MRGARVRENRVRVAIEGTKIDAIFKEFDQSRLPGAAVGIAVDGKPVYRKGFGLANMELGAALSPTIRMRVASISKHFTSLAYLLLCEEGRAAVDDRIGTYLPELHAVNRDVTVRQLMGHVSGLRDAKDICLQFSGAGRPVSSEELLSFYYDIDDVNAPPGTAWRYNNGGYLMLTVALERLFDRPLEEVLRDRIFTPAGMHDSLLRRWDTDFVPNSATLHMTRSDGRFEKAYLGIASAGEGGIVSTVDDMLRWLAHMNDPVVGNAETWRVMTSSQRLSNDQPTGYSVGLVRAKYRGVETLSHSGGIMGGNAHMVKVPAHGLDVVVMANRHDVFSPSLANKILDACLVNLEPVSTAARGPLTSGVFRSKTTARVIQLFGKEGRQFAAIDGYEMPMEPDADGWLWPAEPFAYMRQAVKVAGDPDKPEAIHFMDFGNADELTAVAPAGKGDVQCIAGRYRSDSTGTDAIVYGTDDGARLCTTGRFGSVVSRLECLTDGVWRATPLNATLPGGNLSFASDGRMFQFASSRTWALPFRRCS